MTRAGNLRERHTSWGVSWGDSLSQTWQSETKVDSAGKQPPASSLASIARDFHDVAPQLVVGFPEQYLMVYPFQQARPEASGIDYADATDYKEEGVPVVGTNAMNWRSTAKRRLLAAAV